MHIVLESIQSGFDFAKGKQITDKKTRAKYVIFLAAFVFEDIGQVLIQEIYHPFTVETPNKELWNKGQNPLFDSKSENVK